MDPARCDRLARTACRRWSGHPDHADLVQEARIAIWLHGEDRSDAETVVIARRRAVDAWRIWTGHRRRGHDGVDVVALDDDDRVATLAVTDADDPVLDHGVTGRDAIIVGMLAAGYLRADIARRLGVTAGRVTQLIDQLTPTLETPSC